MSDMNSMSRENRKRQLRRGVISSDQNYMMNQNQEESEELIRRARHEKMRRRLIMVMILAILVLAAVLAERYYKRNYKYTSYETSWEVPLNQGSLAGYELFGNNVLKYTKDGASYISNRGRNVWTESYEMKAPIITVNGDYAAIADKQGNNIYICNTDGKQGEATTVLPISKIAVSKTGVVAAVLEDSTASYITFFRKDGSSLDITIKTKMSGDGYPIDMSLSEDGTQLMCSYVYLQNGELLNRVVFYDFSEIGKNIPNRLVGGFDEPFAGTMVPKVKYLTNPYSCAFSGNGPVFFSSRNLAMPELIDRVDLEDVEIESVFCSENYVGVVVRNTNSEYQNRLEIYKADGTPVLSKEFTYEYTDVDIEDDLVILHNENSCIIYNMAGVEKLHAEFDFSVSKIRKGRFLNTLLLTGPQLMREIKLK